MFFASRMGYGTPPHRGIIEAVLLFCATGSVLVAVMIAISAIWRTGDWIRECRIEGGRLVLREPGEPERTIQLNDVKSVELWENARKEGQETTVTWTQWLRLQDGQLIELDSRTVGSVSHLYARIRAEAPHITARRRLRKLEVNFNGQPDTLVRERTWRGFVPFRLRLLHHRFQRRWS